jgi:hypothetical protein
VSALSPEDAGRLYASFHVHATGGDTGSADSELRDALQRHSLHALSRVQLLTGQVQASPDGKEDTPDGSSSLVARELLLPISDGSLIADTSWCVLRILLLTAMEDVAQSGDGSSSSAVLEALKRQERGKGVRLMFAPPVWAHTLWFDFHHFGTGAHYVRTSSLWNGCFGARHFSGCVPSGC